MNEFRGDELVALRAVRRLDDAQVVAVTDRHALDALREGITMTDRNTTSTTEALRRGRRLGRRGMAAGALGLALLGGGAAYAVSQWGDTPTLDRLNCASSVTLDPQGELHLVDGVDGVAGSGDDVADCAQIRQDAGRPPLADPYAFVRGGTHFVVSRAGVPAAVLAEATQPLPAEEQAALLELRSAMSDWVDGPEGQCFTAEQARAYAQDTLGDVGLSGWTVEVVDGAGSQGAGPCALVDPLPQQEVVQVRAHARAVPQDDPADVAHVVHVVADDLRAKVAAKCLSLPEARQVAKVVVGDDGEVRTVTDEAAGCTTVDMEVGGSIFVTLRGPAVAKP